MRGFVWRAVFLAGLGAVSGFPTQSRAGVQRITVGDWTLQDHGSGIVAFAAAQGRPGGLIVSCREHGIEVLLATGSDGPVPAVPVMMRLDDFPVTSEVLLKPFRFGRYYGADKDLALTAATRIGMAKRKVAFQVSGDRFEFGMIGFERVWPELKRRCALA